VPPLPGLDPAAIPGALANRVLEREAWARQRLAAFAGRVFVVAVGPVATAFRVGSTGLVETTPRADRTPDLTLTLSAFALRTRRVRAGRVAELDFSLSKVARVGLTVRRGDRTVFATSAQVGYGQRGFLWRPPRAPGACTVVLRATDLAGNVGRAEQQVEVLRAHRVRHRRGRRASAPS